MGKKASFRVRPVKAKTNSITSISSGEEVVYSVKERTARKKALSSFGEKLIEKWEQIKTSSNGVPRNPKCIWPKKVLIKFYYLKVLPEIDNFEGSVRGAQNRCSDRGDDGSNGADDLSSNVKFQNAEIYDRVELEENIDLRKIRFFENIKTQIEAGAFVCKCDFGTFYLNNLLL